MPFAERREATLDIDARRAAAARRMSAICRVKPRFDLAGGSADHPLADRVRRSELRRASARAARRRTDRRAGDQAPRRHAACGRRADRGRARPDRRVRPRMRGIAAVTIDAPSAGREAPRRWHASSGASAARIGTGPGHGGIRPPAARARMDVRDRQARRRARRIVALADETIDVPFQAGRCRARRDQRQRPGRARRRTSSSASCRRTGSHRFPARPTSSRRCRRRPAGSRWPKFSLGLLFPFYKSALAVDVQKGSLDYASAFAFDATGICD